MSDLDELAIAAKHRSSSRLLRRQPSALAEIGAGLCTVFGVLFIICGVLCVSFGLFQWAKLTQQSQLSSELVGFIVGAYIGAGVSGVGTGASMIVVAEIYRELRSRP